MNGGKLITERLLFGGEEIIIGETFFRFRIMIAVLQSLTRHLAGCSLGTRMSTKGDIRWDGLMAARCHKSVPSESTILVPVRGLQRYGCDLPSGARHDRFWHGHHVHSSSLTSARSTPSSSHVGVGRWGSIARSGHAPTDRRPGRLRACSGLC